MSLRPPIKYLIPILITTMIISTVVYYVYIQDDEASSEESSVRPCEDFAMFSPVDSTIISIKVVIPENYESSENLKSIYLLDANYFITKSGTLDNLLDNEEGMTSITNRLIENGNIPSAILIGIGYNEQQREALTLNGADSFFQFFKNKLIPEIEIRCKVSTSSQDRVLFGYSASGHFSTYALLKDVYDGTSTFGKYISVAGVYDPVPQFTEILALNILQNITEEKGFEVFSDRTFYCAVGTEDDRFLNGNRDFSNILFGKSYQNFKFKYEEYEGLGHYDIPEIAYEDAMTWVFDT